MERHEVLMQMRKISQSINTYKNRKVSEITEEKFILAEKQATPLARNVLRILLSVEQCNQRGLASQTSTSPQAISETIKKLESFGYVEKITGKINNENFITLTELGGEVAKYFSDVLKEHANHTFARLSDSELEDLTSLLLKINLEE